ncbi:unnamed protein product [Schistosoma margrebowiei]|uniref:Protein SEC13 homolog n=1 Tax=Schistosoma margrebowiei TaxID=48269 RepID=A0A183N5R5_9TREM|nr:unnamed protein product [Schistosoma margrebowiei]
MRFVPLTTVSGIQTIDTNHEDMIHDAQLDYYGTTLATASSDHSVKIFDVRNKKQVLIAHLRDHQGPVWSLSWSHPMYGSLLASCGYDRKVIIWQEINGRWGKVFEYAEHASSVNCVCWAPHSYGLMLACASSDGTISILISDETNSWRVFRIPEAHSVSGSIRGSDEDVKPRIGKARITFLRLKNIWNSKQLSINIKVRIFNTDVKTVLMYEAEPWRTTTAITKNA